MKLSDYGSTITIVTDLSFLTKPNPAKFTYFYDIEGVIKYIESLNKDYYFIEFKKHGDTGTQISIGKNKDMCKSLFPFRYHAVNKPGYKYFTVKGLNKWLRKLWEKHEAQ